MNRMKNVITQAKVKKWEDHQLKFFKGYGINLGVAWYKGNLIKGKFVSFREIHDLNFRGSFDLLRLYDEIDEDDMEEMDIKWNMARLSVRADRFWKKTGKKISIQGTDVAGLDKSKELEVIKKEKEGLDSKLTGFQTASKDLDSLLESQRLDKNKERLGYSAVPLPPAQIYSSPKKDMSWTGLPEFKDDIVTDYSRPAPTVESFPDDAQNTNPSVTETEASPSTISPKSFIKFVKANDSPTNSKTDKAETAKKPPVRRARIAQSLALLPVADEPASPLRDVSQSEACPTDSGFRADQDRVNIAKTSTLPYDSAPRITSPAADEGKINMLKARVKLLEDREGGGAEQSGDDAPIKGRNFDEGEAAAERVSDNTEEMATVLTSMDAAIVLASGVAEVPTGSGSIPTAGPLLLKFPLAVIGMTFEEIEAKFTTVWKQIKNFIPMGSKEEAERFKKKGIRFEQESAKKLKTSEEIPEEVKSPDEKVKEMMQLVPIEEVYVEALQVKHPIIDWKLWALVKESLSIRPPTSDKEMKLWVELKRLYEPDDEDQLWTHTQNLMHAPVEWKLYDMCGVHQVTSKDKEIFMLVEKDYPLRKGLAIGMISYKLQVETYLKMANDLILKIYKIASSPRQQEFPLLEEVPAASEESSHCQKKRDATAVKIALLPKSRRNCQSKSYDSFAKLVPHVMPSESNGTTIVTIQWNLVEVKDVVCR
nr:hypothetical protein [Tanacetum cinerariifolium]